MIEYLPWSKQTLDYCITAHSKRMIPSLDIEFSSICTGANCIYCDSKPYVGLKMEKELSSNGILDLLRKCSDKRLKWIYTCGLGEPLEDDKIWDVLDFAKENEIVISFFTNGMFISKEIAKRLKDAGACIILKMDTFEKTAFDKILGGEGRADKVYCALEYLLDAGYGRKEDYTDLAFSIVPTSLSIQGIPKVIEFALHNGIFPSVGELEKSGSVVNNNLYDSLFIENEKLREIKNILDIHFAGAYRRPICPAIITGLHFNNIGDCIVDRETGLNCKWFMLKEPEISVIGNFKDDVSELFNRMNQYRRNYFLNYADGIDFNEFIFGGCGGNVKDIFMLAKKCLC